MSNRALLELIIEEKIGIEKLKITDSKLAEEKDVILNNIILNGSTKNVLEIISEIISKLYGKSNEDINLTFDGKTFELKRHYEVEPLKKEIFSDSFFKQYFFNKLSYINENINSSNLQLFNKQLIEIEELLFNSSNSISLHEQFEIYALICKTKTDIYLFCIENKIYVRPLKKEENQILYGLINNIKALTPSNNTNIELFELFKCNNDLSKYTSYLLYLKSKTNGKNPTYIKEKEKNNIIVFKSCFNAYSMRQFKKIYVCITAQRISCEAFILSVFLDGKLCNEKEITSFNIENTVKELTNEFNIYYYDENVCLNPFVFNIKDFGGFAIKPEYKNRIIGGANFNIIGIDEYSDTYSNEHLKIDWVRPHIYSYWYDAYLTQSNGVILRKSSKVLGTKDDYINYYINSKKVDIEKLEDYRKKYISELIKRK